MIIVVDTNILVNAIKSENKHSKAATLIEEILTGKYKMCISQEIMDEYEDVLHREYLKLDAALVDWMLAWIRCNSIWIEPKPTTQNQAEMRDEDDRCFFDVAKCLNAKLITRNYKDYPIHELITVIDELYP